MCICQASTATACMTAFLRLQTWVPKGCGPSKQAPEATNAIRGQTMQPSQTSEPPTFPHTKAASPGPNPMGPPAPPMDTSMLPPGTSGDVVNTQSESHDWQQLCSRARHFRVLDSQTAGSFLGASDENAEAALPLVSTQDDVPLLERTHALRSSAGAVAAPGAAAGSAAAPDSGGAAREAVVAAQVELSQMVSWGATGQRQQGAKRQPATPALGSAPPTARGGPAPRRGQLARQQLHAVPPQLRPIPVVALASQQGSQERAALATAAAAAAAPTARKAVGSKRAQSGAAAAYAGPVDGRAAISAQLHQLTTNGKSPTKTAKRASAAPTAPHRTSSATERTPERARATSAPTCQAATKPTSAATTPPRGSGGREGQRTPELALSPCGVRTRSGSGPRWTSSVCAASGAAHEASRTPERASRGSAARAETHDKGSGALVVKVE
jgi:hypothetical protein